MLASGPVAVKVHLIGFYARYLHEQGQLELSAKHLQLHKAIYNEKNWIKPTEFENSPIADSTEEDSNLQARELLKELKPWWKKQSGQSTAMASGRIIKMNPGNLSGFIKSEDGRSLYFSLADWMCNAQAPAVNQKVKFALTRRFNKKTGKENDVAILVNPIE